MTLLHQPHHDGSARFVPDQTPLLGRHSTLFVLVPQRAGVNSVHVRSAPDAEPCFTPAVIDRVVGDDTWWRAEIEVRKPVTNYRFLLSGPGGSRWLNAQGVFSYDVPDVTDFRLVAWDPPPAWAADAVVYEIFPDRFARSAAASGRPLPDWAIACDWDTPVVGSGPETPYQLYGGDLDGVVERLDHVASLGVNTVYLTPIFPARSNHRYDAAAFDRVDPLLGGNEALARLAAALRQRGLRLLGDITTNHCGQTHPWFAAAMAEESAVEREMFYLDGDDYETWMGVKSLPKLNWASGELRRRFLDGPDSVSQRWLRSPYSLDGWRVDVANMTGRRGAEDYNHEVAALMRQAVAGTDGLLVAEHAHDASGDLDRDGWHAAMNYAGFTRPVWNWLRSDEAAGWHFLGVPGGIPRRTGVEAAATMRSFGAQMSWRSRTHSWNLLGSHDTARIRTVVGESGVEAALGLLMTSPGTPMVFAGDEIGLTGVNGEDARRPMPWAAGWDTATLDRYRTLIRLRTGSEALRRGGQRWAHIGEDSLAFLREANGERLLVCVRRRDGEPVRVPGTGAREVTTVYGGDAASVTADATVLLAGHGPACQILRLS